MTAFEKKKKNNSSLKQNSCRKRKLFDKERQSLRQIVKKGSQEYSSKNYLMTISRTQFPQKR